MSIFRLLPSAAMAIAVTLGLLFLMNFLIQTNLKGPGDVKTFTVPEIVMPEREIETEFDTSKPEKPDDPQEAPPELPEPEFETPDTTSEKLSLRPGFDAKPEISGMGDFGDGDMIPLTVVQPEYPRRAAQRGTEGYCTVGMTVSSLGTTKDIHVVDCPDRVFERSSIRAAEKLKYKPRVVDGQPVDVSGVQYKFTFQLAKED